MAAAAAAAAKSHQACLTLCGPIGGSPTGSSVHGISQARALEWGGIAFSDKVGYFRLIGIHDRLFHASNLITKEVPIVQVNVVIILPLVYTCTLLKDTASIRQYIALSFN